nr:restriction endonuclease subunit S [Bacillus sp. B15-48]
MEEALVPKEEQLYDVPCNWVWVKSTKLLDIQYGKGLPTSKLISEGYPVFGANGKIGYYSEYTQEEPTVLMTCRGATCGTINVCEPKSFVTNNSMVIKPKWDTEVSFLKYLLDSLNNDVLISGSAQPQITIKAFEKYYIPLPPLREQKRIANKLDNLLGKIEETKLLIKEAEETFKLRRAAILDKAFHGELTRNWRVENSSYFQLPSYLENKQVDNDFYPNFNIPSTWVWTRAESLFSIQPRNGYSPQSTESVTNIKTIKLGAITKGYFKEDEFKYIHEIIDEDSYLWLKNGDFLIQRANSLDYVGTAAIYTGKDKEFIYPDLIMKGRLNEKLVDSEYMVLWINSHYGKKYVKQNATGTAGNMPKINQKVVKNLLIPLPALAEQKEILKIINKTIREDVQLKINASNELLNGLKQSILAKAFRGELGTNDPSDENAIELLKEVLQEQV